ncbi:MAG TPA: hypothetical protein VD813_10315, partial [Pseudonocardia sp.]|nr:hypothetical protein [Pseudonocardia sp.]
LVREVSVDGRPRVQLDAGGDTTTVLVAAPDAPGVLSAAAGVLALHSLEVHAAEVHTENVESAESVTGITHPAGPAPAPGRLAVLAFTVSPRFGGLPDPALLRADLVRVLDGSLALADALARKERDYAPAAGGEPAAPPRVLWFDDEATGAVVLELRGTDRIGLLHRVAAALEECGVALRWARVATLGASVVDSFCLAGPGEGALPGPERKRIEKAVLAAAR